MGIATGPDRYAGRLRQAKLIEGLLHRDIPIMTIRAFDHGYGTLDARTSLAPIAYRARAEGVFRLDASVGRRFHPLLFCELNIHT